MKRFLTPCCTPGLGLWHLPALGMTGKSGFVYIYIYTYKLYFCRMSIIMSLLRDSLCYQHDTTSRNLMVEIYKSKYVSERSCFSNLQARLHRSKEIPNPRSSSIQIETQSAATPNLTLTQTDCYPKPYNPTALNPKPCCPQRVPRFTGNPGFIPTWT